MISKWSGGWLTGGIKLTIIGGKEDGDEDGDHEDGAEKTAASFTNHCNCKNIKTNLNMHKRNLKILRNTDDDDVITTVKTDNVTVLWQ